MKRADWYTVFTYEARSRRMVPQRTGPCLSIPRKTLDPWRRRQSLHAWIVLVGNHKHLVAWEDAKEHDRLGRVHAPGSVEQR